MRRVFLIAMAMALLTGIAVYLFAVDLQHSVRQTDLPTAAVAVALGDIPENTALTEEMFEIRTLPSVAVSPGTARSAEEILGRITRYPIAAGEQIHMQRLRTPGEAKGLELSYQLKENERAFTVAVADASGVAGFIRAGDFVDIITTDSGDGEGTAPRTYFLLENVRVLKVSNKAANMAGTEIAEYQSVTLCLSPEDSLLLGDAINLGKNIRLILRPVPVQ